MAENCAGFFQRLGLEPSKTIAVLGTLAAPAAMVCFRACVFPGINPTRSVRIVPITSGYFEFVASCLFLSIFFVMIGLQALGILDAFVDSLIQSGLPDYLLIPALVYAACSVVFAPLAFVARDVLRARLDIVDQLRRFAAANAIYYDEGDREFIESTIRDIYGSKAISESRVRESLQVLTKGLASGAFTIDFVAVMRFHAGVLVLCAIDVWLSLRAATISSQLHFIFGCVIFWMLVVPSVASVLESICHL
jgi:hypothetical protein